MLGPGVRKGPPPFSRLSCEHRSRKLAKPEEDIIGGAAGVVRRGGFAALQLCSTDELANGQQVLPASASCPDPLASAIGQPRELYVGEAGTNDEWSGDPLHHELCKVAG